jgi:hypothetical protein
MSSDERFLLSIDMTTGYNTTAFPSSSRLYKPNATAIIDTTQSSKPLV